MSEPMSVLEREIREQPAAVRAAIEANADVVAALVERVGADPARRLDHVVIAARGTSDNAARYAQYLFGARLGLPVALAAPSLITMYGAPVVPRGTRSLVIAISQSGQSPDVVGVLASARASGATTVAITNDGRSPLADEAEVVLDLRVGAERAVAATKTYTASLAVLAAMVAALDADRGARAALQAMPDAIELAVEQALAAAPALDELHVARHVVVLGRGFNYATAHEVALKIREMTGIVAEGFSPADLMHGPIAAVAAGTPVIVVAPAGPVRASVVDAAERLRERGARIVMVDESEGAAIRLPGDVPEWLSPLSAVVAGQVLAMRWAVAGGRPVDAPPGLTKVTTTY